MEGNAERWVVEGYALVEADSEEMAHDVATHDVVTWNTTRARAALARATDGKAGKALRKRRLWVWMIALFPTWHAVEWIAAGISKIN